MRAVRPLLATLLLAPLLAVAAYAHSWYPIECCHQMDCAPVDHVERRDGEEMIVTTRHGTAAVPSDLQRRQSLDSRMHVCMRPAGGGRMKVICVFVPPLI